MYAMNHGSMHNSRKRRNEADHYEKLTNPLTNHQVSPSLTHQLSDASLHSGFGDVMEVDVGQAGHVDMMELTSPACSPGPENHVTGHVAGHVTYHVSKRVQHSPVDGYGHVLAMSHLTGGGGARDQSCDQTRDSRDSRDSRGPCAANGFTPTPAGLVEGLNCQQCDKDLAEDEIYYYDNYTCISCSSVVCRRCSISSMYRTDLYCLGCYSHGC